MTQHPHSGRGAGQAPTPALLLALAGLIPFVAGTLLEVAGSHWRGISGAELVRTYGVVILAFMGGTQWGASLRDEQGLWTRYGYSVLPALLAWPAMVLEVSDGLTLLVAGFAFVYLLDEWMRRRGWLPGWYMRLRRLLTACVLAALAVTLGAQPTAP